MKKSQEINELAKALCEAQKVLKPAPKDSTNPFFKSKYTDLATVIETAREPLTANGLSVSQVMTETEGWKVNLTTILMHTSGQWIESTLSMGVAKQDPQGMGSAITYARRYAYAAIIGLASEADDDGNSASAKTVEQKATPDDWCPIHKVKMDERNGQYGKFYSHKLESGGWCRGQS